jgi:hypothetical protein
VTTAPGDLLERLRELALVEVDTLLLGVDGDEARRLAAAYVGDLEDALAQARTAIREQHARLSAGADPLQLLDLGPERRAAGAEPAITESGHRLAERAAARRDLARLEELVRGVLPRLLEADRRLLALGGATERSTER